MKAKNPQYAEVWGDRVVLKELSISCLIGVILTMTFFLVGRYIFRSMDNIEESLADGYALLIGVLGCILSGVISAKKFKPKRRVEERAEFKNIEDILESAGISLKDEIEALSNADQDLIQELEELELWPLLSLIPESSKNYKAEYKIKAGEESWTLL